MEKDVETISRSDLKACLDDAGRVALVHVEQAQVIRAGTRGEQVNIEIIVEEMIHGSLAAQAQLTRYTSGGDPVLGRGKRYIVAVTEVARFAPRLLLGGFVEVPPGREAAYVEAHRTLIAELGY